MSKNEKCEHCRFYKKGTVSRGYDGECLRYPPNICIVGNDEPVRYFPDVLEIGWCGEFKWEDEETFNKSNGFESDRVTDSCSPQLAKALKDACDNGVCLADFIKRYEL